MEMTKLTFLFDALPEDAELDNADVRLALITAEAEAEHGEGESAQQIAVIREIIANQILDDDPPEVWTTVQRLFEVGIDRSTIWGMLQYTLTRVLRDTMQDGAYDEDTFVDALDALPMPSSDIIINTR